MSLKFRQLEAFRAVVSSGSMQQAATQLFVTQPAISRLIKDLESNLGFALFDRSKGRLILSEQGALFFEALETHFLGIERLTNTAKAIQQNTVKKIKLACSPVVSTMLLPKCIHAINQAYPYLQIDIYTAELTNIRNMMQQGLADIAFCLDFPMSSNLKKKRLGSVDALCAMSSSHRLARLKHVPLKELDGENIIGWLPISSFAHSDEHELLEKNNIKYSGILRTQTAHTRYALIAEDLGISIVEPFTARFWQDLGVVTRPISPTVQFHYVLAYQKNFEYSELIQSILEIIHENYQEYMGKMLNA